MYPWPDGEALTPSTYSSTIPHMISNRALKLS